MQNFTSDYAWEWVALQKIIGKLFKNINSSTFYNISTKYSWIDEQSGMKKIFTSADGKHILKLSPKVVLIWDNTSWSMELVRQIILMNVRTNHK